MRWPWPWRIQIPTLKIIRISNGDADPRLPYIRKNSLVCWANGDQKHHVITFMNGKWPFAPAQNTNNFKIEVPPLGASIWYTMAKGGGERFDYIIDVAPPPPGPGVIGHD